MHLLRFARKAALLVALSNAAGCGGLSAPTEPFGSEYRVMLEPSPPALTASAVSLTVAYGGCSGNHAFALRTRLESGNAALWLQKLTPDQPCDMLITERRTFDLPAAVQAAVSVTLLAPAIDPYPLRP